MTLNNFVRAAAGRLGELWPGRHVHVDCIPQNADGHFFLGVVDSGQGQELDRRRRREMQFQVLYFLGRADNMGYLDWAEAMYDGFRWLEVPDGDAVRRVRLKECRARADSGQRYYQFLFRADLVFWEVAPPGEAMAALEQKEEIKP